MTALGIQFDATRVQPSEPGGNIWGGAVPMRITRTEKLPTSKGDGSQMLVMHVQAIGGQYSGQDNVLRLNLWNKSSQASELAQRELSSICHVTNRMQITDADQLIGAPFIGMWATGERTINDQATGAQRVIPTCECKDYRIIDGRTIKEAVSGQPASQPFNMQGGAPASGPGAMPQGGAMPGAAPQPGFPQQGQQPGPGQAQGGFGAPSPNPPGAQPMGGPASGGGYTPAPNGAAQGMGMPDTTIAGSPGSGQQQGGFGGPQGGFGGGQPTGAPQGFGAPQPQQQPQQGGFGAPQQQGYPQQQQPQGQGGGFQPQQPGGAGPWAGQR